MRTPVTTEDLPFPGCGLPHRAAHPSEGPVPVSKVRATAAHRAAAPETLPAEPGTASRLEVVTQSREKSLVSV